MQDEPNERDERSEPIPAGGATTREERERARAAKRAERGEWPEPNHKRTFWQAFPTYPLYRLLTRKKSDEALAAQSGPCSATQESLNEQLALGYTHCRICGDPIEAHLNGPR